MTLYIIVAVAAFVAGLLVGRRNRNKLDKVVEAAKSLKK